MREVGRFKMTMIAVPSGKTEEFRHVVEQTAATLCLDCRVLELEALDGSIFVVSVYTDPSREEVKTFFDFLMEFAGQVPPA